jgi:hypothetical protein
MSHKLLKTKVVIYSIGLCFLFPQQAHAYLDPGTGSYLIQILVAGLFGSLFFLKSFVNQLKLFFKKFSSKKSEKEFSSENEIE